MVEKLFKLRENGTDVRTEVMAGITTFMTMAYILAVNPSILSATVGRVANRIGTGAFELNGKKYELTKNDNGENTLHGGTDFYNKRMWSVKEEDDTHVVFMLVSPDGDQGFPGEVKIEVSYTVTEENELKIHYYAIPDQDTLLNMTNHSYFNLAGHASGTACNAKVWLDADAFTETDAELIPTATPTVLDP